MSLLSCVICTPLLGSALLCLLPERHPILLKTVALWTSCLTLLASLFLWITFDSGSAQFQHIQVVPWIGNANLDVLLGIDGISLFFVLLTTLLTPICLLVGWSSVTHMHREYCIAFLCMESLVLLVFCTLDLLLFYVFFESVLIPMFLVIGIWGARARKIRAAYQFFLYTLLGSVLMLVAILSMYLQAGSTDYLTLTLCDFSEERQILLWLAFFASFAVKVPMIPVHLWLPEAHVEAPTAGSVVLAGVLLKLGSYGLLRFSMVLFPYASTYFTPLVFLMSLVGIVYASLTTLRQVDLKKVIAYSSVAHMGIVTLGLFSANVQGIEGSLLLQLSHGLVSGALFLCVGVVYDRYKTRLIPYYSGLVHTMPVYALVFLFFTMANLAFPGTSSFPAEMLCLVGSYQANTFACVVAATGMILGAAYSLWLYNRVVYGTFKPHALTHFADINRREFFTILPLLVLSVWMGVYPESFLSCMHASVVHMIL